jgi:hypothetical protein
VGACGPQKNGGPDFPLFQFSVLLHQGHSVVMDRVSDLVANGSGELVTVLNEIQERIDDIHVAARSCERIRLRFMNETKLERIVISRLRSAPDYFGSVVRRYTVPTHRRGAAYPSFAQSGANRVLIDQR